MNRATIEQLLNLNRRFYTERGGDFSETRKRVQPGVRRILERLKGEDALLDLGCGNGSLAQELSRMGHMGAYVGLDSSEHLLEEARHRRYTFPVEFVAADLAELPSEYASSHVGSEMHRLEVSGKMIGGPWDVVTAFAVLHHLPGHDSRLAVLRAARTWMATGGIFAHSNWQFSSKLGQEGRLVPWAEAGIEAEDVDKGDHLVDWRRGGRGVRYVHEFTGDELEQLATASGFRIEETFLSDGADGKSGLYQIWAAV